MKATPGEDAVKIVDMTTKDSEYYINLVDKVVTVFKRTDSSFERNSMVGKMLSSCIACYREIICQLILQTSLLSYFKKLPQPPSLQQPPP